VSDLLGSNLDSSNGLGVEVLRRKNEGRVSGVDSSVLDVLRDVVHDHLSVLRDGVHLDLLGLLDVLGDDDGVISRDGGSLVEVGREIVRRRDDVHRSSRENVRGSNEDWVSDSVAEGSGLVETVELLPERLVDSDLVEHSRELVSVLGGIDHLGRGSVDLDVLSEERESDVVGRLSSHGHHDSARPLGVVDVEDRLERDVLEVEPVRLVVIGGDRLGVVVDHDRLESEASKSPDGSDGAPVELDGGSDSVDSRSQDHDSVILEVDVVLDSVVGRVEVVGEGGELGGDGIDLLDERSDSSVLPESSNGELVGSEELSDLSIRESELLGLSKELSGDRSGGERPREEEGKERRMKLVSDAS